MPAKDRLLSINARLEQKPWITMAVLVLLCIALRIATLSLYPIPAPAVFDEMSNFLGMNTFLSGRLTNPPLLFPDSFYEPNILPSPTRMMFYPPAKALFMALGEIVFGHPYWGVVLSAALMVAASYWCMRGWSTHRVALIYAICMLLLFRAPHYWMDSYWGASHILLAAWMILGAYPRILYRREPRYIWIALFGGMLGAWSRPYETLILCAALAAAGLAHVLRRYRPSERMALLRKTALPVVAMAALFATAQGYYNKAVTLDAATLPQDYYLKHFEVSPPLWMQPENPIGYSDHYVKNNIQHFNDKDKDRVVYILPWDFIFCIASILQTDRLPLSLNAIAFFGITILFLLCPFLFLWRYRGEEKYPLSFASVTLLLGFAALSWHLPHYLAVFFAAYSCLLALLLAEFLAARTGLKKYRWLAAGGLLMFFSLDGTPYGSIAGNPFDERARIETHLKSMPGKHLVFVDQEEEAQYGILYRTWVFNEPDIDGARIIWAWRLSPAQDRRVIDHYHNRKIWYIKPATGATLMPYEQYRKETRK